MSGITVSVPEIYILYGDKSFKVKFPSSDEEIRRYAKSVMGNIGLFGQMMANIASIDQVINDIEKEEESLLNLLLNNDFKAFAARMFLCKQAEVREYGEGEEKKGGGVLNYSLERGLYAEYPALKINDSIFYRADSATASKGGLDLQKILNKSLLKILAHNNCVCQGLDPILM